MESINPNHKGIFEESLLESFNGLYQYDGVLENYILAYQISSGNKKEVLKDQILHRFLQNKPSEIDPQYFSQMYNNFLESINNRLIFKTTINISDFDTKLFREGENKKKLLFILQNTDISESIIIKAQKLSNKNPYHNFGHQLGVAETAILIAQAQGLSRKDINLLSLVGLFHDTSHIGTTRPNEEEIAYEDMMNLVSEDEINNLGCTKDDIKRLILATKFSLRGKLDGTLEKIIQDADLGGIGYGPYYMLYSTMGLIEEQRVSITDYIQKERQFISYLEEIDPKIFLSDGARQIFIDPRESLEQISQRPQEVIDYAYSQKYENISFADFKRNIDAIINPKQ